MKGTQARRRQAPRARSSAGSGCEARSGGASNGGSLAGGRRAARGGSARMPAVTRPPRSRPLARLALLAIGCAAAACRTAPLAPPAPPAPPAVVPGTAVAPVPPPPETVRVTGSRLNVRRAPAVTAATVTRVRRGERLAVLGRDGDWLRVALAGGGEGWVSARYVRSDAPCPADKPGAELLSDPPLSFRDGASAGRVVIEATVDSSGRVAATKVVADSTGAPELVKRAEDEARALKFSPPVRDCRALPFVYTYTRNF